jgi:hypothetical protein
LSVVRPYTRRGKEEEKKRRKRGEKEEKKRKKRARRARRTLNIAPTGRTTARNLVFRLYFDAGDTINAPKPSFLSVF